MPTPRIRLGRDNQRELLRYLEEKAMFAPGTAAEMVAAIVEFASSPLMKLSVRQEVSNQDR